MGASRRWASAQWGLLLLAGGAMMAALLLHVGRSVRADQANSQNVREIHLGRVRLDTLYALTVWIKDPAQLQGNDAVLVTVSDASGKVESKWLHAGDLDFYLTLRPRAAGQVERLPVRPRNSAIAGGRRNAAPRSPGDDSRRGPRCGSGAGSHCRCAQQHLANRPAL